MYNSSNSIIINFENKDSLAVDLRIHTRYNYFYMRVMQHYL